MATNIYVYPGRPYSHAFRLGVNGVVRTIPVGVDYAAEDDTLAVLANSRIAYRLSANPDVPVPAGQYMLTGSGSLIFVEVNGVMTSIPLNVGFTPTADQAGVLINSRTLLDRILYGSGTSPATLASLGGGGVTPVVPLPQLAQAPLAAWFAKQVVAAYSGPLYMLRRASDNATLDVYPATGSALPSYPAIVAFAAGSQLSVVTVYDQTGAGRHLTQATAAQQPLFDPARALAGTVPFVLASLANSATAFAYMKASVPVARNNTSVWQVIQPQMSYDNCVYWRTAIASNDGIVNQVYTGNSTVGLQLSGGTLINFASASIPRAQPSVIGVDEGSVNAVAHIRENAITLANPNQAGVGDTFELGNNGAARQTAYNSVYACWGTVIYPSLTSGDQLTLRSALTSLFAIPTAFTSRVVYDGDSIIVGYPNLLARNIPYYITLPGVPEVFNVAVAGRTMATQSANYASGAATLFTSQYGAGKCVLVSEGGTNDIGISGSTDTALEGVVATYVSNAKTTGYAVGVATLLNATSYTGTMLGYITSYNAWVMAGSSGATFTVNPAAVSQLGTPSDATIFYDGKHLTPLGNSYAAPVYQTAISARLS